MKYCVLPYTIYTIWVFPLSNENSKCVTFFLLHDDIIKRKHFPCHWPFVRGIRRSPVNSPHESQWRGALMFPLICVWVNCVWETNREAGDLRCYSTHYDVIIMLCGLALPNWLHVIRRFPLLTLSEVTVNGSRNCIIVFMLSNCNMILISVTGWHWWVQMNTWPSKVRNKVLFYAWSRWQRCATIQG